MASLDFATVDAYLDELRMEVYIPFQLKELGKFIKEKFGARFKTDGSKKRWVIEFKYAKASPETIASEIEEELYRQAIPSWKQVVSTFQNYACASRRYEVKFAAGGIRIMLPGGHPLHHYLEKMTGMKPERDVWKIPSALLDTKELANMLKRISTEDRDVYRDATEPYQGRTITGKLLLKWSELDAFGLKQDSVVFADYSFLKVADPLVVEMQIHAWPLRVVKVEPTEGGINATLEYLEADAGARSVGRLMAMPREERPKLLDEIHASEKWKGKSAF